MLFNTWFGQVRAHSGMPGGYYFNPKRPIRKIQLKSLDPPGEQRRYNTQYEADHIGNMDIREASHIKDMIGLGFPIFDHYTGWNLPEGRINAPMTDGLVYPDNPAYDTKILEGLNTFGRIK